MARAKKSQATHGKQGAKAMKPVVLMVGADKGGVGKTTVTRTVLDYLASKNTLARAFDAEYPRGTLHRFHPDVTEIVEGVELRHSIPFLLPLDGGGLRRLISLLISRSWEGVVSRQDAPSPPSKLR